VDLDHKWFRGKVQTINNSGGITVRYDTWVAGPHQQQSHWDEKNLHIHSPRIDEVGRHSVEEPRNNSGGIVDHRAHEFDYCTRFRRNIKCSRLWRNELKVGSNADVLMPVDASDTQGNKTKNFYWFNAKVTAVNRNCICFRIPSLENRTVTIDRYSSRLAPYMCHHKKDQARVERFGEDFSRDQLKAWRNKPIELTMREAWLQDPMIKERLDVLIAERRKSRMEVKEDSCES